MGAQAYPISVSCWHPTVPPGTLGRCRMPSAVWQGFCHPRRAPLWWHPGACTAPPSQGLRGCQAPPWRSPRRPRCTRWFPRRPRQATKSAKMAQDASNTTSHGPKMASRQPKRPPGRPKRAPGEPPANPEKGKTSCFPMISHSRLFGLPSAPDGPRGLQNSPTTAQEDLKIAQEGPGKARDGPNRASSWP